MLGVVFSRGRAWHEQDVLIGRLWALAKRLPSGWAFTDPVTGEFLSAQRERGWLTLAVSDTPGMGAQTVVASYLVGKWGMPVPPPLCRYLASVVDAPPASGRGGSARRSLISTPRRGRWSLRLKSLRCCAPRPGAP